MGLSSRHEHTTPSNAILEVRGKPAKQSVDTRSANDVEPRRNPSFRRWILLKIVVVLNSYFAPARDLFGKQHIASIGLGSLGQADRGCPRSDHPTVWERPAGAKS
jgi:hypothetical protein